MAGRNKDKMHGCGIKLSCDDSGNSATQAGLFLDDDFAGASSVCDVPAAKQAAQQALWAANLACGLEVMSKKWCSPKPTSFQSVMITVIITDSVFCMQSQLKADKLDASQTRLHERSSRISHTDAFKQRHVSS
ncbi:TPA: hypothetical protein ACH3X1_009347 [Trebouxia sp. C0004]